MASADMASAPAAGIRSHSAPKKSPVSCVLPDRWVGIEYYWAVVADKRFGIHLGRAAGTFGHRLAEK